MADLTIETLERRLRLAHIARESREYLLDDIRRALVDIGWLRDDDPYGHGDLADVIRQVGAVETIRLPVRPLHPIKSCDLQYVHDAHDWEDDDLYCCIGFPELKATPPPCSINHDCPGQPRPEPLTARGEARCQSQHQAEGEPLVQCALKVHPSTDAHTDYDSLRMTINPPHGRPAELPWIVWRDQTEEVGRG